MMNLRTLVGLNKAPPTSGKETAERLETPQVRFYSVLRLDFFPRLRTMGFKGSGQNFRRVLGDVIHAINIQGNRSGASCIVNLGVHVAYLPPMAEKHVEPWNYKVIDCEFQGRIVDPSTRDWWKYGYTPREAEESARSLIATYFAEAEPKFKHYGTVAPFLSAMECKACEAAVRPPVLGGVDFGPLPARAALITARIHRHTGNNLEARRFAQMGLRKIKGDVGIALKQELESLTDDVV